MRRAGAALPKLGALCKVMSRITLVPKQDHIRRNCWATFFRDPCLLAATYKKVNGLNRGQLNLSFITVCLKDDRKAYGSPSSMLWNQWLFDFLFLPAKIHFRK